MVLYYIPRAQSGFEDSLATLYVMISTMEARVVESRGWPAYSFDIYKKMRMVMICLGTGKETFLRGEPGLGLFSVSVGQLPGRND